MKKLIFMLLFAGSLFAQNLDKPATIHTYTEQEISNLVFEKTQEALRVTIPDRDTLYSKYLCFADTLTRDTIQVADSDTTTVDSVIVTISDTVKFNFNRKYLNGFISLADSNDSATDTLQIFYRSPFTDKLTSSMVALKEMLTGNLVSDNTVVIPGQGKEKIYKINIEYPGEVYITWKTKSGKATRRIQTSFLGIGY